MRAANLSPQTIKTRMGSFNSLLRWMSPSGKSSECPATLSEVTEAGCQEWITHLIATRSQNTASTRYRDLAVFFKWCVREDELEDSPMRRMDPPRVADQLVPILSEAEVSKLLRAVSGKDFRSRRDNAMIWVLLSTGMRLQELAGLELDDLDLDAGVVRIRYAKGGEPRFAALESKCVRALDQYLRVRESWRHGRLPYVWLSIQGRLAYGSIPEVLEARAKQAGIVHLHAHLFRHLFAHTYLARGGGEVALTALAGWSSLDMVKRRYGKALQNERAISEQHRLGITEKW